MMFLQFFIWGSWYVSMTGWMGVKGVELSGLTAWAYSVGPIAAIVSPFFMGMIADRFFASQRVLAAMHCLGGIALLLVPQLATGSTASANDNFQHPLILLIFAHMLCYMPTLGLSSTVALHHLSDAQKQFPIVRVFGTVGWIAGNLAVTALPGGDSSVHQWHLAGGAGIALALFALTLPHTPPPQAGQPFSARRALGLDALGLLSRPSYAVFIIASLALCIPLSGYYAQARNFVSFVGFQNNATAVMSLGQASEVLFMLLMPLSFARMGYKWVLAAGMLAWVLRYGLFALGAEDKIQWMAVCGVLLHGICYDYFFVAGQLYADRVAPKELRAQAQGFFVLITQGLGMFIGARLFSELMSRHTAADSTIDWKIVWLIPAGIALAVLVGFATLFRDEAKPTQT
jgi:nucleoside transporter